MMSTVLFHRPNYELATKYLHAWFGLGVAEAERLGYQVVDLAGDEATLENLEEALNTHRFSALFIGGHGNPDTIVAQNGALLFKACQNDEILANNLAFFLSCFIGQELGPSMVEKGVTAFLGYQNDFRFMVDTSYPVLEDPIAEPFKEVVLEVASRILRGERVRSVWEGGVAKCNEWIRRLWDRPELEWSQVIGFIEHDRDAFIALGDDFAYSMRPVTYASVGAIFIPIAVGVVLAKFAGEK